MHQKAVEAPRMTTDPDGTRRPETEQERIKRVELDARIKASMGRIEAAAERDRTQFTNDYRPGDKAQWKPTESTDYTITVLGRDGQHILVDIPGKTGVYRALPEDLTMTTKGNGHSPTREQAAMDFASNIIHADKATHGGLIFSQMPEGRKAQQVEDPRLCEEPPLPDPIPTIHVAFKKLHADALTPSQARAGDAGYDLHAADEALIYRGGRGLVGTGIAVAIPVGFVGLIMPRSGLAHKHGIDILGGVIDAGYRGEVKVILQNHGGAPFRVEVGDRIAQLVIQPVKAVNFTETDTLPDSERAAGGFGSTGA